MDGEDQEFEVTAEMLIHEDVDDEQTMMEEEALESKEEVEAEVADLQQEGDLPLEELLKRYGYALGENTGVREEGEDEEEEGEEEEGVAEKERVEEEEKKGREEEQKVREEEEEESRHRGREVLDGEGEAVKGQMKENDAAEEGERTKDEAAKLEEREGVWVTNSSSNRRKRRRDNRSGSKDDVLHSHSDGNASSDEQDSTSKATLVANELSANEQTSQQAAPDGVTIPSPLRDTQPDSSASLTTGSYHSLPQSVTVDEGVLLETVVNAADSSEGCKKHTLFPASTSSLVLGQPLLPEEVSTGLECNETLDNMKRLQEDGGGGGGGGGVSLVEHDGHLEEGGIAGEGGDSSLLLIDELGERVGRGDVDGSGGRGIVEDGTDHSASSDIRVHTPSAASSASPPSSPPYSSMLHIAPATTEHRRVRSSRSDPKSRLRPEVPERRSMRLMANDEKALDMYFSSFFDDEDGDEDYVPFEEWKQEIKVGPSYQVVVDDFPAHQPYLSQPDQLLWSPQPSEEKVVSFLKAVPQALRQGSVSGCQHVEQALRLLQECDHDMQKALEVIETQGLPEGTRPWTEEECTLFEQGLRAIGKDFFLLKEQVPSRTIKELVEFYYFWKKSKRYDDFIQQGKIGKKKVIFQPGQVSDFMDNYLNVQDPAATDLHYATTTVYAEHKKEAL